MQTQFLAGLPDALARLQAPAQRNDTDALQAGCVWLKGGTYTLGHREFAQPLAALEAAIRAGDNKAVTGALDEFSCRADLGAYQPPADLASPGPEAIRYALREMTPRNAALAEKFVFQLGSRILDMESAVLQNRTSRLDADCRWINRYAKLLRLD